jgi:hypothetical protein
VYAVQKELRAWQLHALKMTALRCYREMFIVWGRRRVLSAPAQLFRIFLESKPVCAISTAYGDFLSYHRRADARLHLAR